MAESLQDAIHHGSWSSFLRLRSDLFPVIADAKGNEARALAVLRWFISMLKDQYTSRNESMGSEQIPLNSALGELFYGYWPDQNNRGRTTLLVEQVSHHPPITAYVIENKSKGLKLVGHNAQKISFSSGSIIVRQIEHATLSIGDTKYLITLLGGSTPKEQVVEGLWHERSKFTKGPHASSSTGDFHDVVSKSKEIITAVGGEKDGSQGEYETRRLWNLVAKAAEERKSQLKHFKKYELDPIYEKLGKLARLTPPEEDYYEFLANWPESLRVRENGFNWICWLHT
ncbi:Protein KES1 [Leucoagaricus sp. SymC.cos]|nr:Protein KES1 [Leucoagaricus sp. SymC.cos]